MSAALARPAIRALVPYSSARSLATEARAFLDANEAPGDAPLVRYPAPQPAGLVRRLCGLYGVEPAQLFVGRGVDEAIDSLLRVFCEARRDAILTTPPSYGYYRVAAAIQGAALVEVPLRRPGFGLDLEGMREACTEAVKLVFVCSPNNPTGNAFAPEQIASLARSLEGRALCVVDEAYGEFSAQPSLAGALASHPNLVVLRTLSKAWGLAGARCGVALAAPDIIELLHRVRAPYPLPLPAVTAVEAALDALGDAGLAARVAAVRASRAWLAERLLARPEVREVFPSEANFLLVRTDDAAGFAARCRAAGVLVRDRSGLHGLEGCVRISVGSRADLERMFGALEKGR